MRVGLLFYGLHRFASHTSQSLLDSLPSDWQLHVYSHTWHSSEGINAPWVKEADGDVTTIQDFRALWPGACVKQEGFVPTQSQWSKSDETRLSGYPGYQSRHSVYRMISSISRVCQMALDDTAVSCSTYVLTRTDFLGFSKLPSPSADHLRANVLFPDLRRNNEFCDWLLVVDKRALRALSDASQSLTDLIRETQSFAGEDLLRRALERTGCQIEPFAWHGILVRDRDLEDIRFGRLPFAKGFFWKRIKQSVSLQFMNFLDFVAVKLRT